MNREQRDNLLLNNRTETRTFNDNNNKCKNENNFKMNKERKTIKTTEVSLLNKFNPNMKWFALSYS